MRIYNITLLGFLLFALFFALPCVADDPGKAPQIGKIYLGGDQILDAAPPRQLSLRANVSQFDYQPGGDAIAYTGAQLNGDTITAFASLVGTQHGTITKLLSITKDLHHQAQLLGDSDAEITKLETDLQNPLKLKDFLQYQFAVTLNGWSADGKYLLLGQDQAMIFSPTDVNNPPQEATATTYTCADLSTNPPTLRQITLPITLQPGMLWIQSESWWSPKKTLIMFEQEARLPDAKIGSPSQVTCTLYDPVTRHLTSFTPSPNARAVGWLDQTHIVFRQMQDNQPHYLSRNIATRQETEVPKPTLPSQDPWPTTIPSKTSPINPALVLEEQPFSLPDTQKAVTVSSQGLWVRLIQKSKSSCALPIALSMDLGPYEEWSPSGRQIAYLMHGDLFVSDLIARDATVSEKIALGLDLTCDEQKRIGTSNLRQIGSALMQYVQDHNSQFPPAGDISDRLTPDYLSNKSLFSLGKSQFVYEGNGQAVTSIKSLSETEIGSMDTPCAHIVMYADGHVKTFDKQENGQSGANSGPCSNLPLPKIKHSMLSASTSAQAAHALVSSHSQASD